MKPNKSKKVSVHKIDRARVLYASGMTLSKIADRVGIHITTLSKYKQAAEWENDKLPDFTLDELTADTEAMLFLLLQDAFLKVLDRAEFDIQRFTIDLKNLVSSIKELSGLAPMRTAKIAVENLQRLITEADKLPPEQATVVLDFLRADYARQNAALGGLPEKTQE